MVVVLALILLALQGQCFAACSVTPCDSKPAPCHGQQHSPQAGGCAHAMTAAEGKFGLVASFESAADFGAQGASLLWFRFADPPVHGASAAAPHVPPLPALPLRI